MEAWIFSCEKASSYAEYNKARIVNQKKKIWRPLSNNIGTILLLPTSKKGTNHFYLLAKMIFNFRLIMIKSTFDFHEQL